MAPTKLYIEQSAHCDWDWMQTFAQYFVQSIWDQSPVKTILDDAVTNIRTHVNDPVPYVYVFCEVAYLLTYFDNAAVPEDIRPYLRISSGGITSAENLLTHGETFIRNYLVGRMAATQILGITPSNQLWIPDDFGQDAQLPIVLRAMGLAGVAFERVPGANYNEVTPDPTPVSPIVLLQSTGRDFLWQASDGSTVLAHFLDLGYGEGNAAMKLQGVAGVAQMVKDNTPLSPTPLLFSPLDDDFKPPYSDASGDMLDIVNLYNAQKQPSDPVAVLATFDDFIHDLATYAGSLKTIGPATPFVPHPYWSGCYATRPAIKQLHYAATRALLSAETMELYLELLAQRDPGAWSSVAQSARAAIANAWTSLVPSTHHDYMPGTSQQAVYESDQMNPQYQYSLPYAMNLATTAQLQVTNALASAMTLHTDGVATAGILNNLGFERDAEVTLLTGTIPAGVQSTTFDGVTFDPVEPTANGLLVLASAPSLGCLSMALSTHAPTRPWTLSLELQTDGSYVMANDTLSAQITAAGIIALYDLVADPQKQHNLVSGIANQVLWFLDNGSLYEFGFEMYRLVAEKDPPPPYAPAFAPMNPQPAPQNAQITVVDDHCLRKQIAVTFTLDTIAYTQTYTLDAGSALLRMATTGASPGTSQQGYSVMTSFPLATPARSLTFGTPHHWDTREPRAYFQGWPLPGMTNVNFEPAHNFVVANDASGNPILSFFHTSTPAWGIVTRDATLPSGSILNCILRNTPNGNRAANGTDADPHTLVYAIRVGAMPPASTGRALRESLAFNNPLVTVLVPQSSTQQLAAGMSLVSSNDETLFITAAKAGAYDPTAAMLRLYQPANAPHSVAVNLDASFAMMFQSGGTLNATAVTALETAPDPAIPVSPSAQSFVVDMNHALATIQLTRG